MEKYKILIVEDEPDIQDILKFNIESAGFETEVKSSAEEALKCNFDKIKLILLDVMMEKMSGFDFARVLKMNSIKRQIPIIFLTAKDSESDKIEGFDIGADDYITKPFSTKEILARIKSVMKRVYGENENVKTISFEKLDINIENKSVYIDKEKIILTPKEFEILVLLISKRGKVFCREEILKRIWPEDVYVLDRTVDVNITRLRKKIKDYGPRISSRTSYGYYFE